MGKWEADALRRKARRFYNFGEDVLNNLNVGLRQSIASQASSIEPASIISQYFAHTATGFSQLTVFRGLCLLGLKC